MTSPTATGLSAQERSGAASLAADLQRVFGTRLQSVVVYAVAGTSRENEPLRTLALVERLTFEDLMACAPHVDQWDRSGIAVPLLLTREEFFRSLDVFPLEYGDISASRTARTTATRWPAIITTRSRKNSGKRSKTHEGFAAAAPYGCAGRG